MGFEAVREYQQKHKFKSTDSHYGELGLSFTWFSEKRFRANVWDQNGMRDIRFSLNFPYTDKSARQFANITIEFCFTTKVGVSNFIKLIVTKQFESVTSY